MKILITGSSGFIGQHLCNDLSDQHEIVTYDLKDGQDIRDMSEKDLEGVKLVIHLAALCDVRDSVNRPVEYWNVNVKGSKNVFELCFKQQVNVIYTSSSCAKEFWLSPYGYTKKSMESMAQPGQIGLRLTTVYGEGARKDMLVTRIKNNDLQYVTEHKRDYIHVQDVCAFIRMLLIYQWQGQSLQRKYDVGTGVSLNNKTLVTRAKMEVPVVEGHPSEMEDNQADTKWAFKLGWRPVEEVLDYI